MKLNLGCGQLKFDGFENLDYPQLDLRKPLPYSDDSVEEIRMIHVLEHLRKDEAERCLVECRRVLIPEGKLIVEVPDVEKCYVAARSTDELSAYLYGDPANSKNGNVLEYHRWGWIGAGLAQAMGKAGFKSALIRNGKFHNRPDRDTLVEGTK